MWGGGGEEEKAGVRMGREDVCPKKPEFLGPPECHSVPCFRGVAHARLRKTMKASLSWILMATVLTGCSTTQLTNLTPNRLPRNEANVYSFEATWECKRRGVSDQVDAVVLLDGNTYPMKPVPGTKNRWETQIAIPSEKVVVPYQYKFTYGYPGALSSQRNSDLSPSYRLYLR